MPSQTLRDKLKRIYGEIPVAHEAVGIRIPVRVRGRRVAQALMGRARGERRRPRRHRNQRGGASRGRRRGRGHEGGQGQLGAALSRHGRTRPEGRQSRGRRPMRRARRHGRLDAAQGEVPAAHGALHTQRALQGAAQPPRMGIGGPEGLFAMESRESALDKADAVASDMKARRLKAAADCLREDIQETTTYLLDEVSCGTPQAHPHEQHDRTAQPGDQAAHARRGKLPGREQRAHARLRAHPVRHRERMVQPALPGHVPAR